MKTKNSNWEILTKELVTLKEKMELRMKNFDVLGTLWKILFLGGRGGGGGGGGGG